MQFFMLPLSFLSVTFMQEDLMPDWMQSVADFNPVNWAVEASRQSLTASPDWGQIAVYAGLLAAFLVTATVMVADAIILEGRCVPYGEANVWWPVAEAIRGAAGLAPDSSPEETDRALRKATGDALAESGRLDELDRVVDGGGEEITLQLTNRARITGAELVARTLSDHGYVTLVHPHEGSVNL